MAAEAVETSATTNFPPEISTSLSFFINSPGGQYQVNNWSTAVDICHEGGMLVFLSNLSHASAYIYTLYEEKSVRCLQFRVYSFLPKRMCKAAIILSRCESKQIQDQSRGQVGVLEGRLHSTFQDVQFPMEAEKEKQYTFLKVKLEWNICLYISNYRERNWEIVYLENHKHDANAGLNSNHLIGHKISYVRPIFMLINIHRSTEEAKRAESDLCMTWRHSGSQP